SLPSRSDVFSRSRLLAVLVVLAAAGTVLPTPKPVSRKSLLSKLGSKKNSDTQMRDRLSVPHPSTKLTYSAVPNIVPEAMFNWLEDNGWGDVHELWHVSRLY